MWTETQRDAPVSYLLKRISRDDMLEILALQPDQVHDECLRQFHLAIDHRDGRLVGAAWSVALIFGVTAERYLELMCLLLCETWHYEHEDFINWLQGFADPGTIPTIKKAIALKPSLEYLEADDYGSYYKRCLWALQAIGTPEAITVIEECVHAEDKVLRDQAAYRLLKVKAPRGSA